MLAACAVRVDVGAGVHVGAPIEEQMAGVEEAVFGGDVEEGCATETDVVTGRTAIQLWVATMEERRVGFEEDGEVAGAAAQDREDAGNVVARVGSAGQEDLDAGGEAPGVAGYVWMT